MSRVKLRLHRFPEAVGFPIEVIVDSYFFGGSGHFFSNIQNAELDTKLIRGIESKRNKFDAFLRQHSVQFEKLLEVAGNITGTNGNKMGESGARLVILTLFFELAKHPEKAVTGREPFKHRFLAAYANAPDFTPALLTKLREYLSGPLPERDRIYIALNSLRTITLRGRSMDILTEAQDGEIAEALGVQKVANVTEARQMKARIDAKVLGWKK